VVFLLELSDFLFLPGELPLGDLEINFEDALVAGYFLVHFVDLLQILLQVGSFVPVLLVLL